MGRMSRTKGASGERSLSRVLTDAGFPARRGVQYQGSPDSPDVVCPSLPTIAWECKRCERLHLYPAMEQAKADAGPGKVPVIAHRRNDCEWLAVMRLDDLLAVLRESSLVAFTVGAAAAELGGTIESVEVSE